ncbi:lactonase family protein [Sandaracinus amylolyticus]|uniref:lactonase family protein n=1 Tax=Sandaracinus amylolyticus TaxID=927083 RepID=UPI0014707AF5|nr:lactonase family protein [Sandaracinus amylolyticus]
MLGPLLAALMCAACGGDDDASDPRDASTPGIDASDAPEIDADVREDAASPSDAGTPDGGGPMRETFVYVGLTSGDLVVYALDASSGALTERSRTRTGDFPSFLAPSPDGRFLYVVHEGAAELAALEVTPGTGAVRVIDRAATEGGGPTHVAVSPDGRFVAAANYGGGSVPIFPIEAGGMIGDRLDLERPGGQAHQVVFDAGGTHLYAVSKEDALVAQYAVSASGLAPLTPPSRAMRPGAGSRHLALSPDERFAYVIHELDSTITVHARAADATLGPELQRISTREEGASGGNTTAEILVHPSGRFLYGSNRGDDDVVRFRIGSDGLLALEGHESTRGRTPRSMTLTPDARLLIVANQDSRDVQVFAVDPTSGALTHRMGITADANAWYVGAFAIPTE